MNPKFLSAQRTHVSRPLRRFDSRSKQVPLEQLRTKPRIKWFIRYTYYAFVFSLPFEMADLDVAGGLLTLSRFLGYLLVAGTAIQAAICYKEKPTALWCFATYLLITAIAGIVVIQADPANTELFQRVRSRLFTSSQLLVLFWISYNLMRDETVVKGTLFSLAASATLLVLLQLIGVAGQVHNDRATAFDANPNSIATVVSVGLMVLFGLAYGRQKTDWRARVLFWTTSALLAGAIVRTGSRGAVLALALSFGMLWFKRGNVGAKLKMIFLGLIGVAFLAVASYQVEAVRERWERTIYEGSIAGRDTIYDAAVDMFLEKPILGWGTVNHFYELGSRLGLPTRDPHNLYLWILTEVGLVGSIPFLAGLWLCWRTAWKSRAAIQGITPLMMMTFLLASGMKGSWHTRKLFWLVLAYALASSAYTAASNRWRNRPPGASWVGRPRHLQPKSSASPDELASAKQKKI